MNMAMSVIFSDISCALFFSFFSSFFFFSCALLSWRDWRGWKLGPLQPLTFWTACLHSPESCHSPVWWSGLASVWKWKSGKTKPTRDFPGGTMVKTVPPMQGCGFDPWSRNYDPICHIVQSKNKQKKANKTSLAWTINYMQSFCTTAKKPIFFFTWMVLRNIDMCPLKTNAQPKS